MVALIIMIVMLIGMMCIIAHKLVFRALPLTGHSRRRALRPWHRIRDRR